MMFTGIVAATGVLKSRESFNGDLRIRFEVPPDMMAAEMLPSESTV